MNAIQEAIERKEHQGWYADILAFALEEADDVELAITAADRAYELVPMPDGAELGEGWITIGAKEAHDGKKHGGTPVYIDQSGKISRGPAALKDKPVSNLPPRQKTGDSNGTRPDRGSRDRGTTKPNGSTRPEVEGETGRPDSQRDGGERQHADKPVGEKSARRVPASQGTVNKKLDRFANLFRSKGNHQAADWMEQLRDHVSKVGTDAALQALGEEIHDGEDLERVQYEGGWDSMGQFAEAYLNRNGIVPLFQLGGSLDPNSPLVSSASPAQGAIERGDSYMKGDFTPRDPTLPNKLEEAKSLPGLEKSEDINKIAGKQVTNLTPDVLAKMDERYGEGRWIIKAYGDEAASGYGVFFPQRAVQIARDAQNTIWTAGEHLAQYGFSLRRESGKVVGLEHRHGGRYDFDSDEYKNKLYGDAKHWADQAASAAANEQGAALPGGGKEFMAQPAFEAIGVNDADRAAGKLIAPGEGRVHIVTRNGKAEIVPNSTWIKGEYLPVVFESDDTKAMAKAAVDAINALPESERQGQVYAPDILKAKAGYKVVEANPSNATGSSGYLGDSPFIIDAYVSHLIGREPAHVRFIRNLLSAKKKSKGAELSLASYVELSFDIHSRAAQGILNRAMKAANAISAKAREQLEAALKVTDQYDQAHRIIAFIENYRQQLSKLLQTTQLASLLEGMREVARKLAPIPPLGSATSPPPSLSPEDAKRIVDDLTPLGASARLARIAELPVEQQQFIRASVDSGGQPPPGTMELPAPSPDSPEHIQWPVIEEAAKELAAKNVVRRAEFDRLNDAARSKAFTVAGVDARETLTKIRDSLGENVREGADYESWAKKIMADVDEGTFLSDRHAEVVFRTNIQGAFSDGQNAVLSNPYVRSGFPYSTYDAIHDPRVRENHLALEKLGIQGTNIYRLDDPVFKLFRPPWDYNDRCGWNPISIEQAASKGIKEAQQWLETGREPTDKAFVTMPPFRPPASFQREHVPLSIQLSLEMPIEFAWDEPEIPFTGDLEEFAVEFGVKDASGHEHKGKGQGGGQFTGHGESAESGGEDKLQKTPATKGEMLPAKRIGKGKEAAVTLADGSRAPAHIKASMVPPDWTDVQIGLDPSADVLVTGRDKAGRSKTVYADSFHARNAAVKFARTQEMLKKAKELHQQNQGNRSNPELKEHADCTWLMMEQATRPGSDSDTKAKVKAFGATTLLGEHVVEAPDGVRLQFVGKEGVHHDHLIRNPELAKMLLHRKQSAEQRGGKLFDTDYDRVREYARQLDGGRFSPKDFRTKRANELAIAEISKTPEPPKNIKEYKARVKSVAEKVSHVLGNKPAQALESYIDPVVFSGWKVA